MGNESSKACKLMISKQQLIAVSTFNNRAHGFLDDGYNLVFNVQSHGLFMAKFINPHGKRITLRLSLQDGVLSQVTDGKEVFSTKMC